MTEHAITAGGVTLAVADDGDGIPVVLLHGLTASRRYVVMGSGALQRAGHRVIAYDARGHGASSPAPAPGEYGYEHLCADLAAVLDELEIERAVLAGASMGAHTILRLALEQPERVAAMAIITPGYDPVGFDDPQRLARWDALADALRDEGIDGFVEAFGVQRLPEAWRDKLATVVRQRLALHEHPAALVDALRAVPRSRPFGDLHALEEIEISAVVVASRDEADPGHPLALGEAYAELLPDARLVVEEPGESPLAWRGGRLSSVIAELAAQAGVAGR
ncbi:MAG TPA: alpha/beta hydrolase [Solirubrobacteraceae bacterium]|nr:alpha/beta hydrolase [Solirubrobacteraceae bacterium]